MEKELIRDVFATAFMVLGVGMYTHNLGAVAFAVGLSAFLSNIRADIREASL